MFKALIFFGLLATAIAQDNNGDLESIIKEIFGNPNQNGGDNKNDVNTPKPAAPVTTPRPAKPTTLSPIYSTVAPGISDGQREVKTLDIYITLNPGLKQITNDTSCTTEANDVGECVRYYLCNNNNTVINDGVGIIDIRVRDGPCPSYLDTCCLIPDKRPETDPILPNPTPQPNTNNNPDQPTQPQQTREGCGWRNPEGVGFKTTGDVNGEAKFGEFPWMVAILKIEPVNEKEPEGQKLNVYVGGGSLIHPNVVLTAAHYVFQAKELSVRAGEWDTQTTKELYPFQDRLVNDVVVHKDFNKGNLFYDIALLFLSKPFELTPHIGVACLPPPGERVQGGTRCFASGWGKDKFGKEGRYQVILKKLEIPVVERRQCQDALRKTRLGRYFELHSSFMCAGGEAGKDTCKGDGGSPLVCPIEFEEGRYQQNGIVAWGIGCGEDGTPGVYVDVSNLRNWIDDKVKGKGYPIQGYSYTV